MEPISDRAKQAVHSLNKAIADVLEKKRLLGQYAVMGNDGKPVKVPASRLPVSSKGINPATDTPSAGGGTPTPCTLFRAVKLGSIF